MITVNIHNIQTRTFHRIARQQLVSLLCFLAQNVVQQQGDIGDIQTDGIGGGGELDGSLLTVHVS
jgi:hypothetical protein